MILVVIVVTHNFSIFFFLHMENNKKILNYKTNHSPFTLCVPCSGNIENLLCIMLRPPVFRLHSFTARHQVVTVSLLCKSHPHWRRHAVFTSCLFSRVRQVVMSKETDLSISVEDSTNTPVTTRFQVLKLKLDTLAEDRKSVV